MSPRPTPMSSVPVPRSPTPPPPTTRDPERPATAEAVIASLLRSNAADLSLCDNRLREARELVKREEAEMLRLTTIREGLQAGRQAILSAGGASSPLGPTHQSTDA